MKLTKKIKKIFLILLLTLFLSTSVCGATSWKDDWTINGIPLNHFQNTSTYEKVELGVGILTSVAVHWSGHILYLELNSKRWHQEGLSEVCDGELTNREARAFAMSGMITQLIIGSIMKLVSDKGNMFVAGYQIGSVVEVSMYPLFYRESGDYDFYKKHGGNDTPYFILTGWSFINLLDYK